MSTLSAGLGPQLRKFADKTGGDLNELHKEIATELFAQIILDTPVDTGYAVSNWQASMGQPKNGVLEIRDPSRMTALQGLLDNIKPDATQPAWLCNNVPYVQMLEYGTTSYGFSMKAPRGFVRVNILAFKTIVRQQLQGMK